MYLESAELMKQFVAGMASEAAPQERFELHGGRDFDRSYGSISSVSGRQRRTPSQTGESEFGADQPNHERRGISQVRERAFL
jgi:hypothetical protein